MSWKRCPYWLKGGVIAAIFGAVLLGSYQTCLTSAINEARQQAQQSYLRGATHVSGMQGIECIIFLPALIPLVLTVPITLLIAALNYLPLGMQFSIPFMENLNDNPVALVLTEILWFLFGAFLAWIHRYGKRQNTPLS